MRTHETRRKRVVVIGAFDTKAAEYAFLIDELGTRGCDVFTLNTGVLGSTTRFRVDCEAETVAAQGGGQLEQLRRSHQRDQAMQVMARGAPKVVRSLYATAGFDGIIGMGGGCGTSIVCAAMRALPLGVPKVCISTLAGGNVAPYLDGRDIVMVPAIADLCGTNRLTRGVLSRAAGAIGGMMDHESELLSAASNLIFVSAFGNSQPCVSQCLARLQEAGFETIVFHATGVGGRTMESLIAEGMAAAVLDVTTTELADLVCGGVMSAGEDRLSAAGRLGIPQVIVPGCVDMVNFGPMETIPPKYLQAKRLFYRWNPEVTLMRTNVAENIRLGEIFAEKANAAKGVVAFLFPLHGLSLLDADHQPFCDRQADGALLETIRANLRPQIPVVEVPASINAPVFAEKAVALLLDLIRQTKGKSCEPIAA